MPPRRVLITGGAGFLGAHLTGCLRGQGVRVRLFDTAKSPYWARASPDVEYVRGDVRDPHACARAVDGVDAVVHAAFASPRGPVEAIRSVNVEGTRTLCASAAAGGLARFVLVSSTIVLKTPRVHPALRSSPLTRLDVYRESRVLAERVVMQYADRGLSVAIARPKTFIGPGRLSAFALIFQAVRLGRPVPVLGRGRNRYQLLDIRDMAEGIGLLQGNPGQAVFSFGATDFGTVRDDLQALLGHARTGARLHFIPGPLARIALRAIELAGLVPLAEWHHMSARGEDSQVDTSRAERELGWRPSRSNTRALIDAYDWYVATVRGTGEAGTTHPVPLAHRILRTLSWISPR